MIWIRLLLYTAAAGLICSTGFLCLVAYASLRFRERASDPTPSADPFPPVSLLKPLCGIEPNLEANLTGFFDQDYPNFEIIFGTRDPYDPALAVVRRVQQKFPFVRVKLTASGDPGRANAKVCSLEKMYAAASYDYLIISDSDVKITRNYIEEVVAPLMRPEVGMVTCMYQGVPTGGVWSLLEALGMSVEMTAGVLVANLLEGMKFALGPTMGVRRDVLDAVGGFGILADYCSDDYILGAEVARTGYEVVLSKHVIGHVAINRSLRDSIMHQVRWMKSTRFSRGIGHMASILTFAMPFGLLGLAAALALHKPLLGVGLLGVAIANRIILALFAGGLAVHDRRAVKFCWLYPVRDLMGFAFWCASFFGSQIEWRQQTYRLEAGGRMCLVNPATANLEPVPSSAESETAVVAVDHTY